MPDFTFPKNKTLVGNSIRTFEFVKYKFRHDPIDPLNPKDNQINIDGTDYYFTYLDASGRNKGGNSIILKLYASQGIKLSNLQYDEPDRILKILKYKKAKKTFLRKKTEKRFAKEIAALIKCKKKKFQNVISIFESGTCKIYNSKDRIYDEHLYYTMEYANSDLKDYVEDNIDLSFKKKINLCLSLSQGIDQLKSLGYYHRDIKPDNIFIVGETWKIGDLGLLAERDEEEGIDQENDFIGPRGWISPEAMNKFLCEGNDFKYKHDCKIDHQSDIYQLGKVFWYILQNNAPVGVFKQQDCNIKNNNLYTIVRTMLNYSKKRRYNDIAEVISLLKPIENKLQLVS